MKLPHLTGCCCNQGLPQAFWGFEGRGDAMHSQADWAQAAQQFQSLMGDMLAKAMQQLGGTTMGAPAAAGLPALSFAPDKLQELQKQYLSEVGALWGQNMQQSLQRDRRFAGEAWSGNPVAAFSAASYLLNARTLMALADAV